MSIINCNITYIQKNYLTLAQLADKTQLSAEDIRLFIDNQCVPGHSFTLYEHSLITSAMNEHTVARQINYYSPSLIKHLKYVKTLSKEKTLTAIAYHVREKFNVEFDQRFQGRSTPGINSKEDAWSYWINGIWGICLQHISVETMAKKELSRLNIASITENFSKQQLTGQEKKLLQQAIDDYNDVVVKEFVPYMQNMCSRTTEINSAAKKYL